MKEILIDIVNGNSMNQITGLSIAAFFIVVFGLFLLISVIRYFNE